MHDYTTSDLNAIDRRTHPEFSGKLSSSWVLVVRRPELFGDLKPPVWKPLPSNPKVGIWTDDYTPITRALRGGFWSMFAK
jgi:hypothetical protein